VQVHIFLAGRVQGVGFRYFAAQHARRLGLAGFVQNLPDARVEVLAHGDRSALEALVAALREGPPGAVVRDIRVDWTDAPGTLSGRADAWEFVIR